MSQAVNPSKSIRNSIKIEGSAQDEDINRSVSPPPVTVSNVTNTFKIEEWGNIPKVIVDTIEALVDQTEKTRVEL